MHGKNLALIKEIPTQRLFPKGDAARYLKVGLRVLKEITDKGQLKCYEFRGRRTYKLEDLERVVDSLNEFKPQKMKNGV